MRLVIIFLLLWTFPSLKGQEIDPSKPIPDQLAVAGRIILEHPQYEVRDSANNFFTDLLEGYLSTEAGFEDPLTGVTNMLRLNSDNGEVNIYTWQIPDSSFRYHQHGMVAVKTKRGITTTRLTDRSDKLTEPEFRILKPEDWYGAIYYKLIPVKKGRQEFYTLLGYSPDQKINRKVIDVLSIDQRGRPKFGAKIFHVDNFMDKVLRKPPMRLILSYSGQMSATVNWNEEEEMIIMDHLAPPDPKLKGLYSQYGPDLSYDALEWDDEWWKLKQNVDFNTGQHIEIRPPDRPVGPPQKSNMNRPGR